MSSYVLTCCSTADLTRRRFEELHIPVVCNRYTLGSEERSDDMWESTSPADFYHAMEEGAMTRTAQISFSEYTEFWRPFLEDGKDVLHITLSSGLTGTLNSARIAAEDLLREYPGRRIEVVDSLGACSGYGLLMEALAARRDGGASIDELVSFAESRRLHLHHWFFSSDLTYYIRGGRVSRTAGFIGKLLNICPLLNMDNTGSLIPREKVRTKRKVIREIVARMEAHAENGSDYDDLCFIAHSECEEDAQAVAQLVEDTFPRLRGKVKIYRIGCTIGSHTGPGTVALFFWGDERGA